MTHICVSILASIVSNNGLSPGRRQAIIGKNAGLLLIGSLGTNFSEILIEIHTFSFMKMHFKMSSGKWRPFCLDLNGLKSLRSRRPNSFKWLVWVLYTCWRHQMETFSALLAICVGNSPVTQSFDVFFDLHLIERLSKHSRGWWFETLSCPLWRHCNNQRSHSVSPRCGKYLWISCC